eukprot:CAMPEP_0115524584 /NCGR_PEP_ID=MMETSP0271-20121206/81265_1 /TAXON_ID=71861 /ORGANISM="Scrippsiella trochoidea, Strain CCMP3099" /LENGTH=168 /DNA_ID=CAMNT_0002956107 /DNA_START=161 /DNA_END=667 /DNA_ORIENTATION=-
MFELPVVAGIEVAEGGVERKFIAWAVGVVQRAGEAVRAPQHDVSLVHTDVLREPKHLGGLEAHEGHAEGEERARAVEEAREEEEAGALVAVLRELWGPGVVGDVGDSVRQEEADVRDCEPNGQELRVQVGRRQESVQEQAIDRRLTTSKERASATARAMVGKSAPRRE